MFFSFFNRKLSGSRHAGRGHSFFFVKVFPTLQPRFPATRARFFRFKVLHQICALKSFQFSIFTSIAEARPSEGRNGKLNVTPLPTRGLLHKGTHQMRKTLLSLIALLLTTAAASSQTEPKFDFYTRGPYRTNVPTPQTLLRYDVGDHHTTYAQMEKVIEEIAKAASDRVRIFDIGTTNEHRMQHVVAISAPENISRLDEIKAGTARLTDPRKTSKADAEQIARINPATAWMAYTIHGNESASFEALMQVIYQLAASNEPATLDILKNTVVLIVTGENPDGHERFATWYNSVAMGSPDRLAIEHREPWAIWGRVNHYRFNLNRDTLAMTQKETRNMQKAYAEWNPQLAVDHHGQPSQYFFPPTSLPHNPNLPQEFFTKWEAIYGKANAAAFDKNNWDYYVRDVFDAFYPGYWDMYPSLNGAIGMTYETDGGGPKGLKWTRDDGTIVTFRSSIAKHFVASMTTLEANAKNKTDRLRDFYAFRAKGMADHAKSKIKRVIIVPDTDRIKAAEMVETLHRSNIEVKVAGSSFTSNTAHSYMEKDAPAQTRTFPAGSYIIDLDQPQRIFIKSILEQDTPQDKAFVDDNMARFRRNQMRGKGTPKEDYGFYDITAWSLPLALGVNAWWTEDTGSFAGSLVTSEYVQNAKKGSVSGGRAQIAYVIPYETDSVGGFVLRLLQGGHKVAVATRPLNAGGRNWRQGTFVIRVSRNLPTDPRHGRPICIRNGCERDRRRLGLFRRGRHQHRRRSGALAPESEDRDRRGRRRRSGIVRLDLVDAGTKRHHFHADDHRQHPRRRVEKLQRSDTSGWLGGRLFPVLRGERRNGPEGLGVRRRDDNYRSGSVGFRRTKRCSSYLDKTCRQRR